MEKLGWRAVGKAITSTYRLRLTVGFLAAIPFIATLVSTTKGPGLSPDSVNYLSTGINLADGQGLTTFSGDTLTVFPPGLPAVVALGETLGIGAHWTARFVNATAFSLIVVLTAVLLHRRVESRSIAVGATVFVAISFALLTVSSMAWTEPLFIVVSLLLLLALERSLAEPRRTTWLAVCALLVWVAFLLRYAGISLVPIGVVTIFLGLYTAGRALAIRNAAMYGLLASAIPVLWMLRNLGVDDTLMGPRSPSSDTPLQVAYRIAATTGLWVAPLPVPTPMLSVVGVLFLLGLAGAVAVLLRRDWARRESSMALSVLPVVVFGIGYTAYLAVAQLTTSFDGINTRLLSPIFVPLVIVTAVVLDRLRTTNSKNVLTAVGVVLVGILALQGIRFVVDSVRWSEAGKGYASTNWQQSQLSAAALNLPSDAVLYSNRPDGLWAVTGLEGVRISPAFQSGRSKKAVDIPEQFMTDVACYETFLVWFDDSRSYLRSPEELSSVVSSELVGSYQDGNLYRLGSLEQVECSGSAKE